MKLTHFAKAGLFLFVLINFWAILTGTYWLENTTYILFFLFAVILVFPPSRKLSKPFYLYLVFTVLSYSARFFDANLYSQEISLVFMSIANTILITEALKHTVVKNGSSFMMLYFFVVVGINGCLLGYHVLELNDYIKSDAVYSVYIIYYINLLILGIISFIYYLNSYSKKSMFFISLALGLVFADVLRDMGIFYLKDLSVEITESIIRLGCAVFAASFFATKEKQLKLASVMQ